MKRTTAVLSCVAFFALSLSAQTFYGSIVGAVTDASGALAPGAEVALTNLGTSEHRVVQTDGSGNYQFVNLVPGRYRLDITKTGFRRLTRGEVLVEVQSAVRIDASLQVGEVGQVMEVIAETPVLQTENSSLGHLVGSQVIGQMPLNGRNVLNLVSLVPGVVPGGGSMGTPTNTNISAWGNYQIGGGIGNQSAANLDGGPLNTSYNNAVMLVPTQEAIQEFRVQTNNLSAEFGRFGGGVINMTTKSGTNQFHGSVYEFLRNKSLNANTFFNNRSGIGRPAFTQNQYGVSAGGPIVKDKTFFFFGYEGFRLRQGQSLLRSVPTESMRDGDFSDLRNTAGALVTIYDPLTTCGVLGNAACAGTANVRQPFGRNVIPQTRMDNTSKLVRSLWALPNLPGQAFTKINNYAVNTSVGGDADQYNARIDHAVSDRQRLFGRFTHWNNLNLPGDVYKTNTGTDVNWTTRQVVVADTYTFSPSTVGDLRLSFLQFKYNSLPQSNGVDLTQFGWPASLNGQLTYRHVPSPCVQNLDGFCNQVVGVTANNTYAIAPSLTKITGRHTLKFGGEVRRIQFNFGKSSQPGGIFNFDNLFTSVNPFAPAGSGYGFASFLLGYGINNAVTAGSGGASGAQAFAMAASQLYYQGYYVADTFQVNNKLTLNYGVRWELPSPFTERYDRASVWVPDAESPFAKAVGLPQLRSKLDVVNSQSRPERGAQDKHWKLFAPRVGFAYRLTSKTVIRGGYGIFYLPNDATFNTSPTNHTINQILTPWVATLDGGVTPASKLSNPFPTGIIQPPGHDPSFQRVLLGQAIVSPEASDPYPYMQQWNFSIQRELAGGVALEAAYAGSRGVHLLANSQQVDQLPDQYLSLGTALQQLVSNPFYGLIDTGSLAAPTVARGQLLRPFPQYNGVTVGGIANRNSSYHSMQLKLEKRLRGGGTVLGSYTWAKIIADTDTLTNWLDATGTIQNFNNLRLERSLLGTNVPQRLVVSYVQELPFGKGKMLLGNVSGIADKLISGWGVNGVSTFQTGFPIGFTTSSNLTNSFGGGSRPNVVGGCEKVIEGSSQSRVNKWFNTSCFTAPAAFTFGNQGRFDPNLHGPGIANWDLTIAKTTSITERVRLEYRTEFFNLFNRVQFGLPGVAVGNGNFGVISSQLNNPRLIQFALRLHY